MAAFSFRHPLLPHRHISSAANGKLSNLDGGAYNATTGDLQITTSSGGVVATLQFQNSSLGSGSFHTTTDNAGGTLLTHS